MAWQKILLTHFHTDLSNRIAFLRESTNPHGIAIAILRGRSIFNPNNSRNFLCVALWCSCLRIFSLVLRCKYLSLKEDPTHSLSSWLLFDTIHTFDYYVKSKKRQIVLLSHLLDSKSDSSTMLRFHPPSQYFNSKQRYS